MDAARPADAPREGLGGAGDDASGPGVALALPYGPAVVPPGEERTERDRVTASGAVIGGWRVRLAGLHHLNVLDGADSPVLSSSQPFLEVRFPGALALAPGRFTFDAHQLNTSDLPIEASALVEFLAPEPGAPEAFVVALSAPTSLRVEPRSATTLRYQETSPGLSLLLLTSHVHSHNRAIWARVGGVEVYRSTTWEEPLVALFDPPLDVPNGENLEWGCEVENDLDVPLTFRNSVTEGEMCNLGGVSTVRTWVVVP